MSLIILSEPQQVTPGSQQVKTSLCSVGLSGTNNPSANKKFWKLERIVPPQRQTTKIVVDGSNKLPPPVNVGESAEILRAL